MHVFQVTILVVVLSILAPEVAFAKDSRIEMTPMLFGLHLGQGDVEFSSIVKDAQCSRDPGDLSKNICKGTLSVPGAPTLATTGEFVAGVAGQLELHSPTEQGCRWLASEISSGLGKPSSKKRFMQDGFEVDLIMWSSERLMEKSKWVVASICSPDGPGRVVVGPGGAP